MIKPIIWVMCSVVLLSSCSLMKTAVLRPTGAIIYDASFDQMAENDWELFEQSLGGQIKLMEALLSQDPGNRDLMISMQKGHFAQGFGIHETYYLADQLAEIEDSPHLNRAISSYTKALELGLSYLMASGLDENVLSSNVSTPDKLKAALDVELSSSFRNVEAVLFTAQALAALVNLQRENMRAIAYLPVAKTLFDWSCSRMPEINFGTCDVFYGSYDSGRPKMLGGDPEQGKKIFQKAIARWPENYLIRMSYVQFYAMPMFEDSVYKRQKLFFKKATRDFEKKRFWRGGKIKVSKPNRTNVYNMIAIKRMKIIEKYEEDIF